MHKGFEHPPEYKGEYKAEHKPEPKEGPLYGHHHHHSKKFRKSCHVSTQEEITITSPIGIHGHTHIGEVELICGGHEIIREPRRRHGHHQFKICQKFYARIPIEFVAECEIGDEIVEFEVEEE